MASISENNYKKHTSEANKQDSEWSRLESLYPGIPKPFEDSTNPKIAVVQYKNSDDPIVIKIGKSHFEKLRSGPPISETNPIAYKLNELSTYATNESIRYFWIDPAKGTNFRVFLGPSINFIQFYGNAQIFKNECPENAKEALKAIYGTVKQVKVLAQLILSYLDPKPNSLLGVLSRASLPSSVPALPGTAPKTGLP